MFLTIKTQRILNYAAKEKGAILSTLFNQKSDFNVNMNYYQTQIESLF